VVTFSELKTIFEALQMDLPSLHSEDKDQASYGGRIYARTGGVSFSVKSVVNRIAPHRIIKLKAKKVDGVTDCRSILQSFSEGQKINANFIEGMGCDGGCVNGPKTNVNREAARNAVNEFGEDSYIMTPFDNLNITKILYEMGIEKVEEIIEHEEISNLLIRETPKSSL
jgi:iron only hydrogenase large subunit-like protein